MKKVQERYSARRSSPRAALAAVGLKVNSLKLLDPVKQKVVILQKSLRHTPAQKLQDAFIAILAGAHGLSEINSSLSSCSDKPAGVINAMVRNALDRLCCKSPFEPMMLCRVRTQP